MAADYDDVDRIVAEFGPLGRLTIDALYLRLKAHKLEAAGLAEVFRRLAASGVSIVLTEPGTAELDLDELASSEPGNPMLREYLKSVAGVSPLSPAHLRHLFKLVRIGRSVEELRAAPGEEHASRAKEMARFLVSQAGIEGSDPDVIYRRLQEQAVLSRVLIVQLHQHAVLRAALRYRERSHGLLELVGHGNLGVVRALDLYDQAVEFPFDVFASWWVHEAIAAGTAHRELRAPEGKARQINHMLRVRMQLLQEKVREPSLDEIALRMGASRELVEELLQMA